jgi:hypothetical protein
MFDHLIAPLTKKLVSGGRKTNNGKVDLKFCIVGSFRKNCYFRQLGRWNSSIGDGN